MLDVLLGLVQQLAMNHGHHPSYPAEEAAIAAE